jgi:hypothetical protein
MRICLRQFWLSCQTLQKGRLWSGGRDLNLRQSGVCTLDRLNDAHHDGRRLQRLRQPRHVVRLARKLYQAELPPDSQLTKRKHNLCVSLRFSQLSQISLRTVDPKRVLCVCLFCFHFIALAGYSKVKYLNCECYNSIRCIQSSG